MRPWTTGEIRRLRAMHAEGVSHPHIAAALGRTYFAIRKVARREGLHGRTAKLPRPDGSLDAIVRYGVLGTPAGLAASIDAIGFIATAERMRVDIVTLRTFRREMGMPVATKQRWVACRVAGVR